MISGRFKFRGFIVSIPLVLLAATAPAFASLIITPTFDSTFSNTSLISAANAATAESTINSVISTFEADILNNMTVRITFSVNQAVLGSTSFSVYQIPYSSYVTALTSHAMSADDAMALAHLPTTPNPTNSTQTDIYMKAPLMRALAINNPNSNNGGTDATISLGTSMMNLSRTGTQNSSYYDLQSVVSHEIDEALGLGSSLGLGFQYVSPEDLFRYTGTGTGNTPCSTVSGRSYTSSTAAKACFSINGSTGLEQFDQAGTGDYGDWASNGTAQVQDAMGTPGAQPNLLTELRALDVLGYTTVQSSVPEPGTGVLITLSLGLVGIRVRRARKPESR